MIGVDDQRQLAGAADALRLVGEFGQGQHDQVGRAEHRQRRDRTGEHAGLETEILGRARRQRIEDRSGMDAAVTLQDVAQFLAAEREIHGGVPGSRKSRSILQIAPAS